MNNNSSTNEKKPSNNQEQITEGKTNSTFQSNESSKKKNKKGLIIGLMIGIVFIATGVYYYMDFKSNEITVYVADDQEEENIETHREDYLHNNNGIDYPHAYSRFFVLEEYKKMPINYQNGILKFLQDNDKGKDGFSFLTKIPSRAKNIYCFGNFSGENNRGNDRDIAFIAELDNYRSSNLVILNSKGDLLFIKEYYSLPIINSFKKGAKIYSGQRELEPAKFDGIILKEPNVKHVIIYDDKLKQFVEHYQYTEEDIRNFNNETDFCEECEPDDPSEGHEYD